MISTGLAVQRLQDGVDHFADFGGKTLCFLNLLYIAVAKRAGNFKLSLKLAVGAAWDSKELPEFRSAKSSLPLRYVTGDGDSSTPDLAGKSV